MFLRRDDETWRWMTENRVEVVEKASYILFNLLREKETFLF